MVKKKNKILLVWYGGTIVMVVKDNVVKPAADVSEIFDMVPRIREFADIDLKILSNVDSTNVVPEDWTKMSEFLLENREDYDGFIVAHGTNTMSYSASAVALALGEDFWKPIVFTGSQLPLTIWGNDGVFNLENSVKVINQALEDEIYECMVVFSDIILKASRTVKISESSFQAFDSPSSQHLGHIRSTWVIFSRNFIKDPAPPYKKDYSPISTKFQTGIVTIDLTPGQNPFIIRSVLNNRACRGIILKSHGAGSVPTIGDYSFIPLIEEATKNINIPVLISTKFVWGNSYKETNDEPAIMAIKAWAIPTGDLTDAMAEVKLMWLLARGVTDPKDIKNEIVKDYVGEVSEIEYD